MRRSFLIAFLYVLGLPGALAQGLAMYDIAGGDFEQKVIAESANQPVVVMFRSDACAPCNRMTIEAPQMAFAAFAGRVKFYTVNIDAERTLAQTYQVTDVPRIVVFKDRVAAASRAGDVEKNPLFQFFATQASPETKRAYQKPRQELEPKRPQGAELKAIGSWEIERDGSGIAYALRASKYLRKLDETKAGPGRGRSRARRRFRCATMQTKRKRSGTSAMSRRSPDPRTVTRNRFCRPPAPRSSSGIPAVT